MRQHSTIRLIRSGRSAVQHGHRYDAGALGLHTDHYTVTGSGMHGLAEKGKAYRARNNTLGAYRRLNMPQGRASTHAGCMGIPISAALPGPGTQTGNFLDRRTTGRRSGAVLPR